MIVLVELG